MTWTELFPSARFKNVLQTIIRVSRWISWVWVAIFFGGGGVNIVDSCEIETHDDLLLRLLISNFLS
jgi:hypothetical protein